jgi:MoxR-like ATPase
MRRIARDYPAALREWEELPLDELRRRCALLQRLQAAAAERPAVADSLLAGSEPWVGYCLALHQALRRRLDERRLDPQPTEAGRRLSELALAEVAERYAVAPSDVKAAIFTPPKG